MALHLARRKHRLHSNPSLIHLFSTSSSPQDGNESGEQPPQPPSDFKISSYFSGIKTSLKQQSQARFDAKAQTFSGNQHGGDFQDIRRNLNEFRRRAAAPPARGLQDLYQQTVLSKPKLESSPFESLKQNLRQMRPQETTRWSNLSNIQGMMKTKHSGNNVRSNVFGGGEGLPVSVFGEELEERKKKGEETEEMMKSEFIKRYGAEELGEILRKYRPEGKREEGWFSLKELNQRLVKLREVEEEKAQGTRRGLPFDELRFGIQQSKEAEARKSLARTCS